MTQQKKHNPFCWNELATPNVKAAKQFYGEAFGWAFSDYEFDDKTYTMIHIDGEEFGGIWEIPSSQLETIPPHWLSYITVKDLAHSLEKVQQLGGKIKMPITQAGEFGEFAIIVDPTGAHIALWQSHSSCD